MKSEKSNSQSDKPHFAGCVELFPTHPPFIEFIFAEQLWVFPLRQLSYFVFGENPERHGNKTSPTDLLALVFENRVVFLYGWRLELLLDPLMQGKIRRIHAEKFLGSLMIGEAWVSEVKILPEISFL
ncbi:MAG: hypothetical protein ACREDS_01240 [Limisphaerales bacterium]